MLCTRSLCALSKRTLLCRRLRSVSTFNAQKKALQRNRAAKFDNHEQFDYLKDGIAEILAGELNAVIYCTITSLSIVLLTAVFLE